MNRLAVWIMLLLVLGGCREEKHFITDPVYRQTVERDFETKEQLLMQAPQNLFAVFETPLSTEEREALQFLYAYSPLIDLSGEHCGAFLLDHVRHSFKVREEMSWGKEIPEIIFRHFVLPVRGSNESLDSSRMVFYKELRDRVLKCATMEDAALEVNHWCHEKAIYKPTNARTCAPLTMLTTAYGRCGEESVFALAALRAVGIPARQVYTPRWAHCDDNHAWIEVWVDGKWKYLGACEPEPRLDIAWFTAPVRRGLFMLARVFGKYNSDEEIASENANGTVVNVTGNYTDVRKMEVKVTDVEGKPVPGAKVEFRIYNYGEYYPAASFKADHKGMARLTGGLGDWIVWATDGERYGFSELKGAKTDRVIVVLDKASGTVFTEDYDLMPPVEKAYEALVPDSERAVNDRRFMYEDSVRNAFIATFPGTLEIERLAEELGVNRERLGGFIKESRGNYSQVIRFIRETDPENRALAMDLLGTVQGKDLQDTPAGTWRVHFMAARKFLDKPRFPEYLLSGFAYSDLFRDYILNPRIKNELITSWRAPLEAYLAEKNITSVSGLLKDIEHIAVVDSVNTVNIATPPEGVLAARVTDTPSKDLFFVAACRTMGIAARLNPVDGKPEYNAGKGWTPVVFSARQSVAPKGELAVRYRERAVKDPVYYTHFTVSKINNGVARSVDLGSNSQVDMGGGASYSRIFATPVALEEGDYILTTGNRRSDGSVVSQVKSFQVRAGGLTEIEMTVPEAKEELAVLGTIRTPLEYMPETDEKPYRLELPETGYTALVFIAANQEPTNHLVRDMSALKTEFEEKGVEMAFLFTDRDQLGRFSRHDFRPLPVVMKLGYDRDGKIRNMLAESLKLKNIDNLPLIVMVNRKGEVIFISQGYRIGLGTQILKMMNY